jgi:hypothetical protein
MRPLQEPERTPITAEYLDRLLHAFAAEPLAGESFVILTRALRDDPSGRAGAAGCPSPARRVLPPTSRVFRSAGLTLDSFLLRGAELGTSRGAQARRRSRRRLPHRRRGRAARLAPAGRGHAARPRAVGAAAHLRRQRRGALRPPPARAGAARRGAGDRLLAGHGRERAAPAAPAGRAHGVIPLAVDDAFRSRRAERDARQAEAPPAPRAARSLPVLRGRYDARKDMRTLFRALLSFAAASTVK